MRVLHDVFTNDEMVSDAYTPWEYTFDNLILEVPSKYIVKGHQDYGIESEEALEEVGGERVLNLVDAFNLTQTNFDKKSYTTYIKGYMMKLKKHLEENNPERVKPFMESAQGFVKAMMDKFAEYEFWMSSSCDAEAMIILSYWKAEDAEGPVFVYFNDGVIEKKY